MSPQAEQKTSPPLKAFVDAFNKKKEHNDFPIVAFQFVSLNNIHEGKMVWWNYLHKSVNERYSEVVSKFTGKENKIGGIVNTLINWEWNEDSYWYSRLGSSPIIKPYDNNFSEVTDYADVSGVERNPADPAEKRKLLRDWKKILLATFRKTGSTMWISLPHKENKGDYIYSSVFCLFNKEIKAHQIRMDVNKLIRNFIIDYLIDLYRSEDQKKIIALSEIVSEIVDVAMYKPNKYHFTGKIANTHLDKLGNKYFKAEYAPEFTTAFINAKHRINQSFNSKEKKFDHSKVNSVKVFKNISTLSLTDQKSFFHFIYGRVLILTYHIIFKMTIAGAYEALRDKKERRTQKLILSDFQKKFGIDGLNSDADGISGSLEPNLHLDKIIPKISKAEFDFLSDLCDTYNEPLIKGNIALARSTTS